MVTWNRRISAAGHGVRGLEAVDGNRGFLPVGQLDLEKLFISLQNSVRWLESSSQGVLSEVDLRRRSQILEDEYARRSVSLRRRWPKVRHLSLELTPEFSSGLRRGLAVEEFPG